MPTEAAIRSWLVNRIAQMVDLPPEQIDTSVVIDNYGIDSLQATTLSGDLEEWLGTKLSETIVWDFPTIDLLVAHLADGAAAPRPARAEGDVSDAPD